MPNVNMKWEGDQLTPETDPEGGDFSNKYLLTRQVVNEYHAPVMQEYITAAEAAHQVKMEAQATEQQKFKDEQAKQQAKGEAAKGEFTATMTESAGRRQPTEPNPAPETVGADFISTAQQGLKPTPQTEDQKIQAETSNQIENPMVDPTLSGAAGAGAAFSLSRSAGMALMPSLGRAVSSGLINMASDPIFGTAAEVGGAVHPALALPFSIAVGALGVKGLEAIERGVVSAAKAAGKVLTPEQISEQVQVMKGILANETGAVGKDIKPAVDDLTKTSVINELNSEIKNLSVSDILKSQKGEIVIRQGAEEAPGVPSTVGKSTSGVPTPPDMQKASKDFLAQPKPDITTEYAGQGNQRLWGANLDPKTPEDLMQTLVSGQNVFQAQSDEARRYVQTWKQGEAESGKLGLEDMLGRRIGQAGNQSEIINAQDNFVNILAEFKAQSQVIRSGQATDIDKVEYMKSLNLFYAGLMQMSGLAAEAGRSLQVFRRMKTMGNMKLGELQEFMKGISSLPVEKIAEAISQAESPAEIAGLITASKRATTWSMFKELWVNLLIGPMSQMANFAGNTVSSLWMVGEHGTASVISQIPGIGSKEIQLGESVAAAYGWVEGWKDGIKLFGKAWKSGQSQFGEGTAQKVETGRFEPSITAENMRGVLTGDEGARNWAQTLINKNAPHVLEEGGPYAAAADAIGEVVRSGFGLGGTRTLTACDDLFKSIVYRSNLRSLSLRKATSELNTVEESTKYLSGTGVDTAGLGEKEIVSKAIGNRMGEILADPLTHAPEISMDAVKAADYATFTNDLNPAGQAALNLLQKAPPLQLITPFFKTPFNVNKWAMQRSPITSWMFPSFWDDMMAGGAKRDLALARVGMGASLAGVAGYLANEGFITGGGPTAKDKKLRSSLYNTNWKPYSVTFDGSTYYPYKYGFEPVATMMGWTADVVDIIKSTRSDDPEVQDSIESIAGAASLGWAKNALNSTFVSGLSKFIEAVDDPDRNGKAWVQGFAGSFMPGASRDIERMWSPEKKDIQSLMDMYKSKIPGWSDSLPRVRNRWGDVVKVDNRFMSNETQISTIDDELIKIRGSLDKPKRDQIFESNGQRTSKPIELDPHQYEDLVITMNKVELPSSGDTIKKTLADIIKSPEYKDKEPMDKIYLLRGYWNEAIRLGKKEILEKYPDIQQRVDIDLAAQQAAKQ